MRLPGETRDALAEYREALAALEHIAEQFGPDTRTYLQANRRVEAALQHVSALRS